MAFVDQAVVSDINADPAARGHVQTHIDPGVAGTINTSGPFSIRQIGIKSFAGSKFSFKNMVELIPSGAKLPVPMM